MQLNIVQLYEDSDREMRVEIEKSCRAICRSSITSRESRELFDLLEPPFEMVLHVQVIVRLISRINTSLEIIIWNQTNHKVASPVASPSMTV